MVHRLVILALLVGGPAFAQDADTQPVSELSTSIQFIGPERLRLAARGFVPTGDPVVSNTSPRGEVILKAPYRLEREGRLAADISSASLRMKQGAPVAFLSFRPYGAQQAEPIRAWCGPGEQSALFSWAEAIVCMVETSEGKATLVTPLYAASWWAVSALGASRPADEIDHVKVLPAETPSEFELVIINHRQRNNELSLRSQVIGPNIQADKTVRGLSNDRVIPRSGNDYNLLYDGLHLTLTPSEDGAGLNVVYERVMPPIELSIFADKPERVGNQSDVGPAQSPAVGPTPYIIGALRFDPTNMTAQSGVITRGGTLVTGKANYAVTGRLTRTLRMVSPLVNETAEAGSVLHQLEVIRRTNFGTLSAHRIWCGPIGGGTIFSSKPRNKCLIYGARGFFEANWPSSSPSWLATTDRMDMPYGGIEAKDFEIEPSETSLLDPLDIAIQLHRVTAREAIVRIVAMKDGEEAMVYQITAPFAEDRATLPLWSHKLVLTRSGNGVSSELTDDGDGTSPVLFEATALN